MSRPHQERCEGDGCFIGLGGLVVPGGDPAPLLQTVEAPFHDVAVLVCLAVEGWRAATAAAAAGPVADLVGPLGDRVGDAPTAEPGADRFRAVALVAQDVIGPNAGTAGSEPGHPDRLHHGGEAGAVVGVAAREDEAERPAPAVAGQVDLAGQAASGPTEGRVAEPPFRAPAACW